MRNKLSVLFAATTVCLALGACSSDPGEQAQPATVEILEPAQGALLNVTRVRIKGRALNTREVKVNGKVASVVAGVWEAAVDVGEGEVVVRAEVKGAQDEVSFKVDATPPTLEITSPKRGEFIDAAEATEVLVTAKVSDAGVGLSVVSVNEQLVEPDDQGNISFRERLIPGLNLLKVRAIDQALNESQHTLGVVYGPLTDPTSPIAPGFNLYARQPAINAATQVLKAALTPELVKGFVDQQLMMNDQVTIEQIGFDPVELTVTPKTDPVSAQKDGFLDTKLVIKNLKLVGQFKFGGQAVGLEVAVSEATAQTKLYLRADGQGGLSIQFDEPVLDLPRESLSWKVTLGDGELNDDDVRVLGDIVEDIARLAFAEILNARLIEQLYDPAILNRRIELLGRTLEFTLKIDEVIINGNGVFVRTSIVMPAEQFEQVPQAPGALSRVAGRTAAPMTNAGVTVTTDRTAVDRLMHGVWRSGLLNQELKGADFAGFELPFELNAGALALLVDARVNNYVDSTSAVGIALRPQLPPIIELEPDAADSSALRIGLGELHVDVLLGVDGPTPQKLMTLAMFLDLGLSLKIEGVQLGLGFDTTVSADLIDEPLFDLADANAEDVFVQLISLVPSLFSERFVLNGEADLTWVKLTNPTVEVHGLEDDQLTIGLDVEANPDGVLTPGTQP